MSFFFYGNLFSFYCLILQEHKLGMSVAITAALIAFTAFVVFATTLIATVIQEYIVHLPLLPLLPFLVLLSLLIQAFAYLMVFVVTVNVFTVKLSENMQQINELKAKNKELEIEKNKQEDELNAIIIPLKREINELKAKNKELEIEKNEQEDELNAIIIPLKREINELKKNNVQLHNKLKASNMRLAKEKN